MPARKKGEESGEGRVPVKIGLRPATNATVNRWLDLNGGWGKAKFIETLVERFAGMPESVQQIMLGRVPEDMREDYAKRAAGFFEAAAQDSTVWDVVEEEPIVIPAGGGKRVLKPAAKQLGKSS
jgi:hypothetical protein